MNARCVANARPFAIDSPVCGLKPAASQTCIVEAEGFYPSGGLLQEDVRD
jgi:hypothetical protein